MSEDFEEKYALREYHNKKTQFEVRVLFNFYKTQPDLFSISFILVCQEMLRIKIWTS